MAEFWRVMRHAVRLLRRAPGFTTVSVLTLGLGIGACAAIFTVVYSVLLAPLPYADPERLVQVWQVNPKGGRTQFSDPNFADLRDQARSFVALAQYSEARSPVAGLRVPLRARVAVVSRDMPRVLRLRPMLGRWFVSEEQRLGGRAAMVVSHAFWRQFLDATRDLSRRTVTYEGEPYTVVGVLPPDARFPGTDVDLWVPSERWAPLPSRTAHNWRVIGRLADGVPLAQARAEAHAIASRLKQQYGEDTWMADARLVPLRDEIVGSSRVALLVLLAGAGFLLLVACANVVNLLLTRAVARRREVAIRAALGGARVRLVVPFVVEAMLLATAGSVLGMLMAVASVNLWLATNPQGLARLDEVRVSWPVLAFAMAIACGSAIVMGLLAGWRITRAAGPDDLREGARSAGAAASVTGARGVLVVAQIATSLVLLVGAGLLGRTVLRLLDEDPGFRIEHVVTMELTNPRSDDDTAPDRLARFHDAVLERVRALPGVVAAGGVNVLPLGGTSAGDGTFIILSPASEPVIQAIIGRCGARLGRCGPEVFEPLGRLMADKSHAGDAEFRVASDQYFRAMGIPLVRGRAFGPQDDAAAPHVAVVSESLVRTRWPERDPLGLRIEFGNMDGDLTPLTIVGIVGDVRERGLDAPPRPTLYASARQRPRTAANFIVVMHTSAQPGWLMARAREIVHVLDPDVPPQFRTIEQVISASMADRTIVMTLLAGFAAAALLLAAIGIYGVISYAVAQRTREIGVRLALGAQRRDVTRLVMRQGLRLTLAGIVLGALVAVGASRVLSTLLYGVTAGDPLTYTAVAALLALVAVVAAHVPARRAARVDPMVALRAE
jgi:putative ABC transport system permease protein